MHSPRATTSERIYDDRYCGHRKELEMTEVVGILASIKVHKFVQVEMKNVCQWEVFRFIMWILASVAMVQGIEQKLDNSWR